MIEKCSGWIDFKCKHGFKFNGSPICNGHPTMNCPPEGSKYNIKKPECQVE